MVGGVVAYTPSAATKQAIDVANAANATAIAAATLDNERKTRETFVDAAKARIEAASSVGVRKERRTFVRKNASSFTASSSVR